MWWDNFTAEEIREINHRTMERMRREEERMMRPWEPIKEPKPNPDDPLAEIFVNSPNTQFTLSEIRRAFAAAVKKLNEET